MLTKQEGKDAWAASSRVRKPGGLLCHAGRSLRCYGDGISFWLSLANQSQSESFLVTHTLLSQDGCHQEGFWEVVDTWLLLFNLS